MTSDLDKLAPALVAFQADLQPVDKSAANPFFKSKYAPLPEVMKAIQPLLAKHKLAVSQFPTTIEGQSALRTLLLHESGQVIEDVSPLLLAKQDAQSQGSAMTYARRYGVMAVLGVVADEDDDGNHASTPSNRPTAAPQSAGGQRLATDKQKGMISALAREKGKDNTWIDAIMTGKYGTLTTSKASEIIDQLQDLPGEADE